MIINEVIFNASLEEVITELKVQLEINHIQLLGVVQDTPDNLMVACPYHKDGQEKKPSMGIHKETAICHCFACDKVVGLPELISHCFGQTGDLFGWQWLLKNFLTVSVENRKDIDLDFERTRTKKQAEYVTEEELDGYRYLHPYMYKRKLTNEIIELFDIGYDHNTDCITFPIRDISGRTLFIARRSVKTKFFNYPSKAEKPLYGIYEISKQEKTPDEIIICESMIDALTCWVYGKCAVALNGLGTDLQFRQLRALSTRKYIIATDMDSAGIRARQRIREALPNKILTEYVWELSKAKDINDMDKRMFDSLEEIF